MKQLSRRKFISISSIILGSTILPINLLAQDQIITWTGKALGASSNITLYHEDANYTKSILQDCINEITRLENIFSLFKTDSSIVNLNKNGFLNNPPKELVEILTFSKKISKLSNGNFDITVQPLWNLHSKYASKNIKFDSISFKKELKQTKKYIGYKRISISNKRVEFKEKNMSITLNGIAQGFITDKITELLYKKGFTNALVNLGEIRGLGKHANGNSWKIGFDKEYSNKTFPNFIELKNRAVATSGGYGTKFNDKYHHLFNPKIGTSSNEIKSVTIVAPSATLADALSTAVAVMSKEEGTKFINSLKNINSYIV